MTSTRGAVVLTAAAPALLAGLLTAGPAPGTAAEPRPGAQPGARSFAATTDGTIGTLISGEESYVRGRHVWTDYVYDDRGANTDPLPGGDEPAPAAPAHTGTADIVQVQMSTTQRGALRATAVLRTIVEGEDALVGIGFDTDRDTTTGAPSLPGDQLANTDALGLEHLVTMGTDGSGHLWTWTDGAWVRGDASPVSVQDYPNTVHTQVEGLRPGRATWRAVAVAGRLEGGASWVDGGVPLQDLAYLRAEDPTDVGVLSVPQQLPQDNYQPYQDWDQADVLAGNLPAGRAVASVDFGTTTSIEPRVRTGFNAFLYHSDAIVPEGEVVEPRVFSSALQPYGVWIPETLPEARPLVVFLHGSDQYQNVNVVYFNNPDDPAGIQPYHDLQAVTIFPNGRTSTWGTPLSDRDALDSIADALSRPELALDPDRIVVTGISSGGYGSFHLASRYPDLFTGAYSIVGGAAEGDGVEATPVENLTNVPFRASNGTLDPLVDYSVWRSSADALAAAGTVDYRTVIIHTGSHNGAVAEGACFLTDLVSRDRVLDPGLVRFSVPPVSEELAALRILPRGAYWVGGLRHRDPDVIGSIEAASGAKPSRVVVEDIAETGENTVSAADFCGPNPDLRRGQVWQTEGRVLEDGPTGDRQTLTVTLTNLETAVVDLRRTGVDLRRTITLDLTTDGPARVTLRDGRTRRVVTMREDGQRVFRLRP